MDQNPGTPRVYEIVVLLLGALSVGITAYFAAATQLKYEVPAGIALALMVANSVIPYITNRMDALGEPQGNTVVLSLPETNPPPN